MHPCLLVEPKNCTFLIIIPDCCRCPQHRHHPPAIKREHLQPSTAVCCCRYCYCCLQPPLPPSTNHSKLWYTFTFFKRNLLNLTQYCHPSTSHPSHPPSPHPSHLQPLSPQPQPSMPLSRHIASLVCQLPDPNHCLLSATTVASCPQRTSRPPSKLLSSLVCCWETQ